MSEVTYLMDKVKLIICAGESVHPDVVFTHTRQGAIKTTRQIIAFFIRRHIVGEDGNPIAFGIIGQYVGLDHATVMHSCKTVQGWYDTDKFFREKIDAYDVKVKDFSGMINLNVGLLLAEKIKKQFTVIKRDYADLDEIMTKLKLI
jgi:hypothetical protein